jgi:hypothetical protein
MKRFILKSINGNIYGIYTTILEAIRQSNKKLDRTFIIETTVNKSKYLIF